jgi:DNA-binding transcriptional regulator YhcF (GntR family)
MPVNPGMDPVDLFHRALSTMPNNEQNWATRTGRWRRTMRRLAQDNPPITERLYLAIREDIDSGHMPGGALLPAAAAVSSELALDVNTVKTVYARLAEEGVVLAEQGGRLRIRPTADSSSVGEGTQIRFEAALIKAVREAAARGLSSAEATGMFRAARARLDKAD